MSTKPCTHSLLAFIDWLPEGMYGPDEEGWAMPIGEDDGATVYVNVAFCPFCGAKLPDRRPPIRPN